MSDGKISFSFGGAAAKPAAPTAAAPMSNLERLMAAAKAKSTNAAAAPPKPAPKPAASLFADDDDDLPRAPLVPLHAETSSKASSSTAAGNPRPPSTMSRAERRQHDEAMRVDASVFDYDGVYDSLKAAERAAEDAKKAESAERKPKYIENFLASAQTRRLDRLRAEEKMLALERDKEGDEFADKEKFVTEAYKKQMAEVRKAEEEEQRREEELRKSKKGPGLTALYQNMLDDSEAKHAAAVAASTAPSAGPSLAIRPPPRQVYDDEEEYDPLLAAEARQAGTSSAAASGPSRVEINDDGEVIDKRTLLKAGLNITKKPKLVPDSLTKSQPERAAAEGPYVSRAVGSAASYGERMARERQRLAQLVKEEEEKKRAERAQREAEEEERARKRREGDDGEAARRRAEAKQRYEERKRKREEEDAAKKAAKVDG